MNPSWKQYGVCEVTQQLFALPHCGSKQVQGNPPMPNEGRWKHIYSYRGKHTHPLMQADILPQSEGNGIFLGVSVRKGRCLHIDRIGCNVFRLYILCIWCQ